MRKWTVKEAVACISEGNDIAGVKEIAKHYPMFFAAVAKGDINAVAQMMPEKFTLRKLIDVTKEVVAEEGEEPEVKPKTKQVTSKVIKANKSAKNKEKVAKGTNIDVEELKIMTAKELYDVCIENGHKVPKYGKKKSFYIDVLLGNEQQEEVVESKTTLKKAKANKDIDEDSWEDIEEDEIEIEGEDELELDDDDWDI